MTDGIDPVLAKFIDATERLRKIRAVVTPEADKLTQEFIDDFVLEAKRLYPGRCAFCGETKQECECPYDVGRL